MLYEVITTESVKNILTAAQNYYTSNVFNDFPTYGMSVNAFEIDVITSYSIHYTKLYDIKSNKIKECTAKDFIGQFVGHTAPKASKLIEENRGGLIFIDEAYVFAGPAQQFAQEALAEIMKELETNRTAFIFAGYT